MVSAAQTALHHRRRLRRVRPPARRHQSRPARAHRSRRAQARTRQPPNRPVPALRRLSLQVPAPVHYLRQALHPPSLLSHPSRILHAGCTLRTSSLCQRCCIRTRLRRHRRRAIRLTSGSSSSPTLQTWTQPFRRRGMSRGVLSSGCVAARMAGLELTVTLPRCNISIPAQHAGMRYTNKWLAHS